MNKVKKDNILNFPNNINESDREIEAILFAAAEPLDVDTIEQKITKKTNVLKALEKLQVYYSKRGINLVCISNKWSFRTAENLSKTLTKDELLKQLSENNISCKDVSIRILGFSLAAINTIFSIVLSVIFIKLFLNYEKN